jgi:Flp pilus assembly protein TadG
MKRLKENKGVVLVLIILGAPVFLGLTTLAVDMGYLYTVRNQLQNAVDSGALGGASNLGYFYGGKGSEAEVRAEATQYATQHLVTDRLLTSEEITIAVSDNAGTFGLVNYSGPAVQVCGSVDVSLFFGGVWGFFGGSSVSATTVSTCGVAGLVSLGATCGLRPWGLALDDYNTWTTNGTVFADPDPNNGCQGPMVEIHHGAQYNPVPGWFSALRFPGDSGGNDYRDNIIDGNGCEELVDLGERVELVVEPGNKVGPTIQGLDALEAMYGLPYEVPIVIIDENPANPSETVVVEKFVMFRICGYEQTGQGSTTKSTVWGEFLTGEVSGGEGSGGGGIGIKTEMLVPQLVQ